MLRIISSNRQEALLDALAARLRVPPDANPLAPERVVAERGMNTWVLQQLAEPEGFQARCHALPHADGQHLHADLVWSILRLQLEA